MTWRFDSLRIGNWEPKFITVDSACDAADCINWVHKDYPKFVEPTELVIPLIGKSKAPSAFHLVAAHRNIFRGEWDFAGHIRKVNVTVGNHRPPDHDLVGNYLRELQFYTDIETLDDLTDWYTDFETIHPFQDGNGRVGGVIVAAYSKALTGKYLVPDEGWSER